MKNRMIGVISTVDQYGLYQIGDQVPWGNVPGNTELRYDNEHFRLITQTAATDGKKNVLVTGYETAKAMAMRTFENCHTIVVAHTLSLQRINQGRSGDAVIHTEKTAKRALGLALSWEDCGHVFFVGAGAGILSDVLHARLCNCAFVTVVKCDAFEWSTFKDEPFHAPFILDDKAFIGMKRTTTASLDDTWNTREVELEFRNYEKA